MTVRVTFLGSGNSFADGGRSNACIHVSAPEVSLLLDCGGSALPAIKRAMDPATIEGIAVTHLHGDHFGGIPFFVMEQHYAGRRKPLTVAGPAGLPARLRLVESGLFGDWFATTTLTFSVRELALGTAATEVGGASLSAQPVKHGSGGAEPHGLRARVDGKVIAYTGDAQWTDALPRLAKGADLFICESTRFAEDDDSHLCYRTLMKHRAELDCRRIILTHLGAETLAHAGELELEYAVDGTTLEV